MSRRCTKDWEGYEFLIEHALTAYVTNSLTLGDVSRIGDEKECNAALYRWRCVLIHDTLMRIVRIGPARL